MKMEVKRVAERFGHHGGILLKGCMRMLYGTATAGLVALAVYGFVMIPSEGGYVAVCDFIGSAVTMVVALGGMYAQGGGRKRGRA